MNNALNKNMSLNVNMNMMVNMDRGRDKNMIVRYHCGGWSEEVNSCILNSYMVYL